MFQVLEYFIFRRIILQPLKFACIQIGHDLIFYAMERFFLVGRNYPVILLNPIRIMYSFWLVRLRRINQNNHKLPSHGHERILEIKPC